MRTVKTIAEARQIIDRWKKAGDSIALVPTMGNLHAGHLKLVETAKNEASRAVVSLFVNPTQFGPNEDYSLYPRTEVEDCLKLEAAKADLLFLPAVPEIYNKEAKTVVSVKELSSRHCGASRPGHFDGVATVVCKLFNIVKPDKAIFGLKDYQQYVIIRTMAEDLNMPVEIIPVATVREHEGLALSSRNSYLSPDERKSAPWLYQALARARDEIKGKAGGYREIEESALNDLKKRGFEPDYFSICNAENLLPVDQNDTNLVILTAAKLGNTRLIDNISFSLDKQSTD